MKTTLRLCSVAALLLVATMYSCKKNAKEIEQPLSAESQATAAAGLAAADYQLVWSDEFNGTGVDASKWSFETGPGVNNEKQYYQAANASVSNGNLVITARKQSINGWPYTSARMNTAGHFTTRYGRIEARIKLASGQGLWPAFWMLGNNFGSVGWPKCGEIDIMEQVNTSGTIYGTIHWDYNGYAHYGGTTSTNHTDYHVYAVEWDASEIRWYVDGNHYHTANILNNINGTEEFHNPFFIILNMAVAGDFPGQTVDESKLPANMYVDYVRVFAMTNGGGTAPIGSTITLKGLNNAFVSSENGTQPMTCNRPTAQAWEQFTVVDAGGGKIALRSQNKYVSSENGAAPITCNRTVIDEWEKFDWIVNADGTISLRGNNGRYISAENGTQAMTCNRTTISGWEAFRY
ncbi:family 16 glycosylhydrolase [Chitinophaga nivalis]|uniref:Family 16 glycosylhydrolase n=1 Tax=Chitinophaga nivalis TaxID=2991709 RepID=A0ABT3IHT9_9BACT|nr:family 16 glycosylhydrolase [Chitinophaga nivalis]MCW3466769.1 family 16 glycosylhydrolase [Chitinophaga nivalis]MCW3483540.1 family 16 glycosylhydrolase [Chitinophaga nivalis]